MEILEIFVDVLGPYHVSYAADIKLVSRKWSHDHVVILTGSHVTIASTNEIRFMEILCAMFLFCFRMDN